MSHQSKVLTILNTDTLTYGVDGGADAVQFALLPGFDFHRVKVLTGNVDVSSRDNAQPSSATPLIIEAGKTPTLQNEYILSGVGIFSFTANADSTIIITSRKASAS